jgi:23S rRNA (pseudouridine1915-N3)-methyltransferase
LSITIVVVGRTKEPALAALQRDYLGRIARYTRIRLVAVREEKSSRSGRTPRALLAEGSRILANVAKGDFCVVLDGRGKELSSSQLADLFQDLLLSGKKRLIFVVGGPEGLDDTVRERADLILSFSKLTFTHEMMRVLLLEQLYRAWTIIRREKYHK